MPAFYARPSGAPIRATHDVDVLTTSKWSLQLQAIGDLVSQGKLIPDEEISCRYQISASGIVIDILSPEGMNVGGASSWLEKAAAAAQFRPLPDGRAVRVVTPPYFVILKLAAFLDRGRDLQASKDMEDIVCIAVEVDDLVQRATDSGLRRDIADLWERIFEQQQISRDDIVDFVVCHIRREDREHEDRVVEALTALADPDA